MAFQNSAKTVRLTDKTFSDWAPGSFWEIRSQKHGADDDAVEAATTRRVLGEIDQKAVRAALKRGDSIRDLIPVTDQQIMSTRNALLAHMSVCWGGPEFTLPHDHPKVDDQMHPVKSKQGRAVLDPYAGSVPPCDEHYIRQQDPYLLAATYEALVAIWAGRPFEEEAAFPAGTAGVDESGSDGPGADGEPETVAA